MKISTKVADGMCAAGLVGILGSVGLIMYESISLVKEHPQVVEMHQEMEKLSNNYSGCISSSANEADCQRIKEKYNSLQQQNNLFEASDEYRQFKAKQADLTNLLFPLIVGGVFFSSSLWMVGETIYRRRKEEELYQDLMGKVEKS
ncbi:MAG: hypothetical protein AABW48_04465 [Nanoarchaeota archaeon]